MNDVDPGTVRIGDAVIGAGRPVYVVAEAGVNHDGDVRRAIALIDAARNAGANAVKFQAFRAAALVTRDASATAYQQEQTQVRTQRDLLSRLELDPEAFAALARFCRDVGIEFLATPFGVDDLAMLTRLGVRAIKIASSDITNAPLLSAAEASGTALVVSTGAAEIEEVDAAVALLDKMGARDRLVLLHCVSSYPTRESDANLRRIRAMAARYRRPVGFSDHTTSIEIGGIAAAAGAVLLEKHITLDRRQAGPDHPFSLEPEQFAEYVAGVREAEAILGHGRFGCLDAEREVRRLARSSVVTSEPIAAGQRIRREMLTIKRPGTGIAPADLERVVNRVAVVDIAADTLLGWEMIR